MQAYKPSPSTHKGPGDVRSMAGQCGRVGDTYIDKVLLTSNQDEHFLIKVRKRVRAHPCVHACMQPYARLCVCVCVYATVVE